MTPELIAIISASIALAGLILAGNRQAAVRDSRLNERIDRVEANLNERIDRVEASLIERIDRVEASLNERIDRVEASLNGRIERVEASIVELHGQVAHPGGFLEGLRDAIVRERPVAAAMAQADPTR